MAKRRVVTSKTKNGKVTFLGKRRELELKGARCWNCKHNKECGKKLNPEEQKEIDKLVKKIWERGFNTLMYGKRE